MNSGAERQFNGARRGGCYRMYTPIQLPMSTIASYDQHEQRSVEQHQPYGPLQNNINQHGARWSGIRGVRGSYNSSSGPGRFRNSLGNSVNSTQTRNRQRGGASHSSYESCQNGSFVSASGDLDVDSAHSSWDVQSELNDTTAAPVYDETFATTPCGDAYLHVTQNPECLLYMNANEGVQEDVEVCTSEPLSVEVVCTQSPTTASFSPIPHVASPSPIQPALNTTKAIARKQEMPTSFNLVVREAFFGLQAVLLAHVTVQDKQVVLLVHPSSAIVSSSVTMNSASRLSSGVSSNARFVIYDNEIETFAYNLYGPPCGLVISVSSSCAIRAKTSLRLNDDALPKNTQPVRIVVQIDIESLRESNVDHVVALVQRLTAQRQRDSKSSIVCDLGSAEFTCAIERARDAAEKLRVTREEQERRRKDALFNSTGVSVGALMYSTQTTVINCRAPIASPPRVSTPSVRFESRSPVRKIVPNTAAPTANGSPRIVTPLTRGQQMVIAVRPGSTSMSIPRRTASTASKLGGRASLISPVRIARPSTTASSLGAPGPPACRSAESERERERQFAPDDSLTFPRTGRDSWTLANVDLATLRDCEFLNDGIINFYLKWIYHRLLPARLRERTHVFNTFFYSRLTDAKASTTVAHRPAPKREAPPNPTPLTAANGQLEEDDEDAEVDEASRAASGGEHCMRQKHANVSKWTRNVDLFDKDFILIPINVQAHWLIAVVCYPGRHNASTSTAHVVKIPTSDEIKPHTMPTNFPPPEPTAPLKVTQNVLLGLPTTMTDTGSLEAARSADLCTHLVTDAQSEGALLTTPAVPDPVRNLNEETQDDCDQLATKRARFENDAQPPVLTETSICETQMDVDSNCEVPWPGLQSLPGDRQPSELSANSDPCGPSDMNIKLGATCSQMQIDGAELAQRTDMPGDCSSNGPVECDQTSCQIDSASLVQQEASGVDLTVQEVAFKTETVPKQEEPKQTSETGRTVIDLSVTSPPCVREQPQLGGRKPEAQTTPLNHGQPDPVSAASAQPSGSLADSAQQPEAHQPKLSCRQLPDRVESDSILGENRQPCVILFDSLVVGRPKYQVARDIREYLQVEWDTRKASQHGPRTFASSDKNLHLATYNPVLPTQTNCFDCGLYLLEYAERFFTKPIRGFVKSPKRPNLEEWFAGADINNKRDQIRKIIFELYEEQLREREQGLKIEPPPSGAS